MWVVKLGGSLVEASDHLSLSEWLRVSAEHGGGRVILVPGGGPFANQVRRLQQRWQFSDSAAHRMALLAMQQMALLFLDLEPRLESCRTAEIPSALARRKVALWRPEVAELDQDNVAASWTITSDSLAAWLARKIAARRLILVKSKVPPSQDPQHLRDAGIVDACFCDFLPASIEFNCYYKNLFDRFAQELCTFMR
ncbi:MAG: uridylate kinase [Methylohalobius sp.]|nr:uridylate kinase [Methylohalobius sp.]